MQSDRRRIFASQAVRAFAYGFGSVLLGASLEARGWSGARVGLLLASIVAGTALASMAVGAFGDRIGRRRLYVILYSALAASGVALATTERMWILVPVALAGALSTEASESGPFTSLEQAMLASVETRSRARAYGAYNAIAALAGSAGALAAGGPDLLRRALPSLPADHRFFLLLVPAGIAGAALARALSGGVEREPGSTVDAGPLRHSRPEVARLAGLFAVDSFGGGFVVQSFIAFYLRRRFGVSLEALGVVFFCVGLLQTASYLAAPRIAERIGLLNTMVFTHIPSNVLLALVPVAPSFTVALALLFGRYALSQMDVPTRQAYVMALVAPGERTAAAAFTNTARYVARPFAPALAGLAQRAAAGLPFVIAGTIKGGYDLALWWWFRRVPLAPETATEGRPR